MRLEDPLTLAACGDVVLAGRTRSGPLAALAAADLAFGNLEIPFGSRGVARDKHFALRGQPELAGQIGKLGLNVVSLANNHAMDFGPEGLFDCMDLLEAAGVACVGAGQDLTSALRPHIVERAGLRIAFVAFSALLPAGAAAGPERPGVAPLHVSTSYEIPGDLEGEPGLPPKIRTEARPADVRLFRGAIETARNQADVVIVLPHWGVARQQWLCEYQPAIAHELIDSGADAIFGAHSHILEGCEIYHGKPIFYSLSQLYLVLDHPVAASMSRDTVVVHCHVDPAKLLTRLTVVPVRLRPHGDDCAGEPELAHDSEAERILSELAAASPGVDFRREGDVAVVDLV